MTETKRGRFEQLFRGIAPDRPLISAWRHFIDAEHDAESLAQATIRFQKTWDWDFVKINPRATHFAEAWGNEYDYAQYEGVVARVKTPILRNRDDFARVTVQTPDNPLFREQLEVISRVREGLGGEVPILQTLFSPLAVLEYLLGHRTLAGNRPAVREATPLPVWFQREPELVHQALENILLSLRQYAEEALRRGADGFFYAVLGLARAGYLTEDEYERFGRAYDIRFLQFLKEKGAFLMLHTCGPESHPDTFARYPIHALHWADRERGNPDLAQAREWLGELTAVGGVHESLFVEGHEEELKRQAVEAVKEMRDRPFILAPGCGLPLQVTDEALRAFRSSVQG
jgi:uroporphyrinogen decarboxylase